MRGLPTCRLCLVRYSTSSSLANLPGPSRASIPRTAGQYPIQAQLRSYASRPPKDGAVDSQDAAAKSSTFIQEFNYDDTDEGGGEDLRESFYLTDEDLGDLTPTHRFGLDLPDPEELSHTASSSFSKAKGNRARSKRNLGDEFLGPTGRNPYPAKIELYRPEHDDKTELENTFRTRSERERDERGRISEAERAEFEAEHAGVSRAVGEGGGVGDETTEFQEWVDELNRRKRKAESKRRMGGFADHILVKVRGGKGGTGTASFGATRVGSLGPPTGGNGGPGGSVYLTTSPSLTSLHSLKRSAIGQIGYNGAGDLKHGSKGKDFILEVPIGTVITEIAREGSEEAIWHDQEAMNMPDEMRRKLRWERRFHVMSGAAAEEEYFIAGERALRKEKKWPTRTPTFEEVPPVILDIDKAIEEPILLARGGLGGMGNPFFHGLFGYKPPRLSSKGLLPYTSTYELELKMLADVGLVGFPNVGKSTILRGLTGRRAEVANYEFTTLNPQIGVVRVYDDGSFATSTTELDAGGDGTGEQGLVIEDTWREKKRDEEAKQRGEYLPLPRTGKSSNPKANLNSIELDQTTNSGRQRVDVAKMESYRFSISDNPGLLPQASENIGLGHSFLRSIERSLVLAYVLDIKKPDPAQDFLVLRAELNNYKKGLSEKGCVVILNKGDEVGEVEGREKLQAVKRALAETEGEGMASVQVLSGKFGLGLEKLVKVLGKQVLQARERVQRENEIKEAEAKEAAEAKWKKYNLKETSISQEEQV